MLSLFPTSTKHHISLVAAIFGAQCMVTLADERQVSFNDEIRPIFNQHCTACHGGVKMAGDLSLIYRQLALGKGKSGKPTIVPGHPEQSELIRRITTEDPDELMPQPKHGPRLSEEQVDLIRTWIRQGAEWQVHWGFEPPRQPELPQNQLDWGRNRIDAFILAQMEQRGLTPSPRAGSAELLRRLSFDLTGLPPTLDELDAFEKANAENPEAAWHTEVERLLASPAYGERWTSVWMDLARYADSEGLGADRKRDVWPYRDWLIRAYNSDMPYDAFTIKQLAGDLLEEPSYDDRIATVFNRLTQSNAEGGTDDEEFRVAAVMDRVNTTWEVWQGQTFACVQCHSHPYDTFEHDEYYKFLAFFNNDQDADQAHHAPTLRVPRAVDDYPRAEQLQAAFARSEATYYDHGRQQISTATWQPVRSASVTSSPTRSQVVQGETSSEVRTVGNVARNTEFNLHWKPQTERLDAIKLTFLPKDPEVAVSQPENGSVLSYAELRVTSPNGEQRSIPFRHVIPDSTESSLYPEHSLNAKNSSGWGPYTKMFHSRWAVLVPAEPVMLEAGSEVTLHTRHRVFYNSAFVLVPHRFQVSYSADPSWDAWRDRGVEDKQQFLTARSAYLGIKGPSIPVMARRDAQLARKSHLFERGNWLELGKEITAADPPAALPSMKVRGDQADRLDMARWLVSKQNPLTARVEVNRYWQQLFGRGIVETLEDFGSSGMAPTHPQLLDDLAVRFQTEFKWSRKALLREIVMSATYQQTATADAAKRAKDPDNVWLSYAPRRRIRAEAVRDMGLAVSGLLSDSLYGHPTYPPIPPGVWQPFQGGDKWSTPKVGDPQRYRRALYTYWKRSIPYPALLSFDTPTREICSKRRLISNTPVAALTTLNDAAFAEFAQGLARRMKYDTQGTLEEKIALGYRLATSHRPDTKTLELLVQTYQDLESNYRQTPAEMKGMAGTPDGAAFTVLASLLLNLDAAITK